MNITENGVSINRAALGSLSTHNPPFTRSAVNRLANRLGGYILATAAFLLTLLVFTNPARAQGYYEQYGPYCFGTGQQCFGDPVDVATGSFHIDETLFRIPGRLPMTIGWQFISQDASDGPLGVGTSLSTDYFLAADNGLELLTPSNRHFIFYGRNASGDFINTTDPEVLGAVIFTAQAAGSPSILRWISGVKFFFDTKGSLYRIEDQHGNFLTIARNLKGYPTEISQADGRSMTFAYNASGTLESLTAPLNRTWLFSYDTEGRLISVTDPAGARSRYTWTTYNRGTALPLVQSVIDRQGHTHVTNGYDLMGRVTSQTYADGGVLTATYPLFPGGNGTTTVTDPRGNVTSWEYEWTQGLFGYNVTRVTDSLGRASTFERNSGTNLVTGIVDFLGRRTALVWDHSRGLLESVTRPTAAGGTATWNLTYDPVWNRLASVTDPLLRQTRFSVDQKTGDITEVKDALNNTTRFSSSAKGDLTSVTNALGQTTRLDYTEQGDLRRITDPLNHETEFTYDDASRVTAIRDANLKTVQIGYNLVDLVTSLTQTLNGKPLTTTFQYDAEGNLRFLTDAKNQTWEWLYDDMGRVAQEKDPLSQSAFYSWDRNGNLLRWTDRLGQKGEYTYGTNDRLAGVSFRRADGTLESTVGYTYNESTELLESITDSLFGTYSYTYDAIDRLAGRNGPNGSLSYTLDDLGRRIGMQVTGQGAITYVYDATDNLASITQDGQIYSFSYDGLGRLINRKLPNSVSTVWEFDEAGSLKSIVSAKPGAKKKKKKKKRVQIPFDSHAYTRDAVGTLIEEDFNGELRQYTYDDLYRLVSAKVGGVDYNWAYDEVGNRLRQTVGGQATDYAYDSDNRLTAVGGVGIIYDANGSPLTFGSETYNWDVRGRLTTLTSPGLNAQFTYDPFALRASKNLNSVTTAYLLDGLNIVSEISVGSAVQTLHGPAIDQPLSRGGLYFTPDHLGSTTTLTDSAGTVVQRYLYSPFGETSQSSGVSNPFQFTGRENDGTGLYYSRARSYAPQWGRFISQDPIRFASGGTNLYEYPGNNPVNLVDPLGLGFVDDFVKFVRAIPDMGKAMAKDVYSIAEDVAGYIKDVFGERFAPPVVNELEKLASEEGATAQREGVNALQVLRANKCLSETGNTEEYVRIKELSTEQFLKEFAPGWNK